MREPTIAVDASSSREDLAAAARILEGGSGIVMFGDRVILTRERGCLRCDVSDPDPSARRCAAEYEVLVENARRALDSSGFPERLPRLPVRWRVVDNTGNGITELWPCETR